MKALLEPIELYSRLSVLYNLCSLPEEGGLCAWYFKEIPSITPNGCVMKDDFTLLYVGSTGNLRERVKCHFTGNAEGSTLRRSLGVLFAEKSGYPLRRVGSGKSMTFTPPGESWLNDWMEQNAFVCWTTHLKPSEAKLCIIKNVSPPLNIEGNKHTFSKILSKMRREAKRKAGKLFSESNQQRQMLCWKNKERFGGYPDFNSVIDNLNSIGCFFNLYPSIVLCGSDRKFRQQMQRLRESQWLPHPSTSSSSWICRRGWWEGMWKLCRRVPTSAICQNPLWSGWGWLRRGDVTELLKSFYSRILRLVHLLPYTFHGQHFHAANLL